ncbi:MAG TPA: Wzz/FepE/Etk N-terminal domain-containing protein [Blastocatellia bacterium]
MNEEEIRLDKYLAAIWRAKWLIIAGVLLAAGVAYLLASRQPTIYKATALLKIGRVWKEPLEDPYVTETIVNSAGFHKELAKKINVNPRQLKRNVHAETIIAGPRRSRYPILVSITATSDENADDAVQLTQAVADELIARHEELFNEAIKPHIEQQRRLEERYKELAAQGAASRDLLLKVEDELNQARANNSASNVNVTEKTRLAVEVVPEASTRPTLWRNVAAAALLAAVACIAAAALAAHFMPARKSSAAGE